MSRELAHLHRKAPRKTRGFAWARLPNEGQARITWRLTRTDVAGRLYAESRTYPVTFPRHAIARDLCAARRRLLDTVDTISLEQLGVTA